MKVKIKRVCSSEPQKNKKHEIWQFVTPRGRVLLTAMRKSLEYYIRNTAPQEMAKLEEIPWSRVDM